MNPGRSIHAGSVIQSAIVAPPDGTSIVSPQTATICQVLHSLNVGGAEVLAARLAWDLSEQYRFVFACLDDVGPLGERLAGDGFQVEYLDRKPGVDFRCARRLGRLIRAERVEIIHAHQYTPFAYSMMSVLGRRPPVLFTEHGRWFPDLPRRKRIVFNRLMLRKRDRVVGVGQSVRRALVENEGIPADRVGVIYNGVDLAPYEGEPVDRAAVRREIGIGEEAFVIIQVARLDALKDHKTAVRTMQRVSEHHRDALLVLVGEGPECEAIQAEISRLALGDRVLMLGLRDDVPRLLAAADLFLLTSVSEGIPLTLIEAMAARLPVVSTNVGGVGEVIADGECGLLRPSGDDAQLAEAILSLAADPERRREMGERGHQRAHELFSELRMHEGYCRLYEEMLGG